MRTSNSDIILAVGDFNAKIGKRLQGKEYVLGIRQNQLKIIDSYLMKQKRENEPESNLRGIKMKSITS